MSSFLASPKNEMMGFFNQSKMQLENKINSTTGEDSTMVSRELRSKTAANYEIRCKHCLTFFESVDKFMAH